ncbi:MAG: hypothetical protein JSW07_09700 [bacterium]|nr:MAG: hypothetical protein JSW07_09700 [bacterium]
MKDELIEEIRMRRKKIFLEDCHGKPEEFYKMIIENERKEDPGKLVDTVVVSSHKVEVGN